nr:serine/threonine-protein kinase Pink1 [Penaeus stylirostris]
MRKGEFHGTLFAFLGFVCSTDLNVKTNKGREEEEDFQRLYQWMARGATELSKRKELSQ